MIRELNYIGMARLAALGVVFALAGCVTVENSLSQNDIANMKLTGVTVSFTAQARLTSEDIEQASSEAAKPSTDDQTADRLVRGGSHDLLGQPVAQPAGIAATRQFHRSTRRRELHRVLRATAVYHDRIVDRNW